MKKKCKICNFKGSINDHADLLIKDVALLRQHLDVFLDETYGYLKPKNISKWLAHGMHMPSKNDNLSNQLKNNLSLKISEELKYRGWKYDGDFKVYVRP